MSTRPLLTILLSAVALAGFVYSRNQQSQLQRLRASHATLAAEAVLRGAADSRPDGNTRIASPTDAAPAAGAPASPLSPAERQELMHLRSQVTELKQRQRALAGVTNENVRLNSQLRSASNYFGGAVPRGYLRREAAQLRGASSPEAALESLLWAVQHRDLGQLQNVFAHPEQLEQDRGESFFREAGKLLRGYRILRRKDPADVVAVLEVELGPATTTEVQLTLQDGRWRVDHF